MTLDDELAGYLHWLTETHRDRVDFAVLFGSRARGQGRRHSDYDVLIGLHRDSDVRLLDRLLEYSCLEAPLVEPIPLGPSELAEMWLRYGRTLLDAAVDGIVLIGADRWAAWRDRVVNAMTSGILERREGTWIWHRELEPAESGRMQLHRDMQASERAKQAARNAP